MYNKGTTYYWIVWLMNYNLDNDLNKWNNCKTNKKKQIKQKQLFGKCTIQLYVINIKFILKTEFKSAVWIPVVFVM